MTRRATSSSCQSRAGERESEQVASRQLLEMIDYTDSLLGIKPNQLHGFFAGWASPPSRETHLRLLEGSSHFVLAQDSMTQDVVGFVTAISDGVLAAAIPLLEVRAEWRGRGIGSELMHRVLAKLDGHYMIDLLCDPELQQFYERFGLSPATGMCLRNHRNQSGRVPSVR